MNIYGYENFILILKKAYDIYSTRIRAEKKTLYNSKGGKECVEDLDDTACKNAEVAEDACESTMHRVAE